MTAVLKSLRQRPNARLLLTVLAMLLMCLANGCNRDGGSPSQRRVAKVATTYNPHDEVLRLQTALAPRLSSIDPDPKGRKATLRSLEAFALALSEQDVSTCPEDFRSVYEQSRDAWIASAVLFRHQAAYYKDHPVEDPEKGGRPGSQAREMALQVLAALQKALVKNKELRTQAEAYGVAWP